MWLEFTKEPKSDCTVIDFVVEDESQERAVLLTLRVKEVEVARIVVELENAVKSDDWANNVRRAIERSHELQKHCGEEADAERRCYYTKVARALVQTIERNETLREQFWDQYRKLIGDFLFPFRLKRPHADEVEVQFWNCPPAESGKPLFTLKIGVRPTLQPGECEKKFVLALEREPGILGEWRPSAAKRVTAKQKRVDGLIKVIRHFLDFAKGVEPYSEAECYLRDFGKALLTMSGEAHGVLHHALVAEPSLIPGIIEFIVATAEDHGTRKLYLDRLVAIERSYEKQTGSLGDIVNNLRRNQAPANVIRETTLLIAEYFLRVYDLDSAASMLKMAQSAQDQSEDRDDWLRNLLLGIAYGLYEKTLRCTLAFASLVLGLTLLIGLQMLLPLDTSARHVLEILTLLILALFYLATVSLPILVLYKSHVDKLPYFQLFFPRLFGAIVVGFLPLAFDSTPWRIGSNSTYLTLVTVGILALLASGAYLRFDAHKMLATIRSADWPNIVHNIHRMFWIGLIQSLTVSIVISSLLSPVVLPNGMRGVILNLNEYLPISGSVGAIGVYPTLIFLWAGIALFIGAFAQLLWQARRITEPL
jgi:hypothetical protein